MTLYSKEAYMLLIKLDIVHNEPYDLITSPNIVEYTGK
jgi:hypothetical protein